MSDEVVISVKNVSKKYRRYASVMDGIKEVLHPFKKKYHKEFWALRDVSFDIKKGETIGIIGRNGSGKSTLLQILCGVLQPTSGTIEVKGRVSALLELGAGFSPEFTGRENVYMNGVLMGFSKEEIDAKFDEIVDFSELGEFIDQPVRTYSSGMYVRLAFAVAINVDPDILMVDEALAVGDMFFQAKCMTRIQKMMDKGVTVLFVTHDMKTVKALCKKSLFLNEGRNVSYGKTAEVTDYYVRDSHLSQSGERTGDVTSLGLNNTVVYKSDSNKYFKIGEEFGRRVEPYRYGTGETIITELELLDENEALISEVGFNQKVIIRIYLLFKKEESVSVTYHIRDDKNTEILSSNTMSETGDMIVGKAGDRFIVDFRTKVPLIDGNYNIVGRIVKPVIVNRSANIIDSVENASLFKVLERSPYKIWSKAYCDNDVSIWKHVD